MKQFIAQYNKDFCAYFSSLTAYVILGVYAILSCFSTLYSGEYFLRESDVMNAYFIVQPLVLIIVVPAITMRTWADETKSGTIELLLTQPISYFTLTIAKFAAAFTFFIIMLGFSIPLLMITQYFSILDFGLIWAAYSGLFLCGALFTATGCCLSVLCRNSVSSYIVTTFTLLIITWLKFGIIGNETIFIPLDVLNFDYNYNAFLNGLVTWGNAAYFIIGAILFLWLNIVCLAKRQIDGNLAQKNFAVLIILLLLIFFTSVVSIHLFFNNGIDFTDTQRYTFSTENKKFLQTFDKRITITLYEAKNQREEENSNYAAYAEYLERLLKRFEKYSSGVIQSKIVRVEAFSSLETRLLQENIPFEEDGWGNKIYMIAEFSDNEGNLRQINSFNSLRQNFIETDIVRLLRLTGQEKKHIALMASSGDLKQMQAFNNTLTEFYHVDYIKKDLFYLPPIYDAVLVINPTNVSTESLLALEQYVLNGGALIIFQEPQSTIKSPIINFANTFGILPTTTGLIKTDEAAPNLFLGESTPIDQTSLGNIRSVLMNGAGEVKVQNTHDYAVTPLLQINGKTTAVVSEGKFATNYPELAAQSNQIISFSTQTGKVFFIYDSDLLKDYIWVLDVSKGHTFYETIPLTDNSLFVLQLLDKATGSKTEDGLIYHFYPLNHSSIGIILYNQAQKKYAEKINKLSAQLKNYQKQRNDFINSFKTQEYTTIKRIGNINNITQKIDETTDELHKMRQKTMHDYQNYIACLTIFIALICPFVLLIFIGLLVWGYKKYKLYKIRRLVRYAETH